MTTTPEKLAFRKSRAAGRMVLDTVARSADRDGYPHGGSAVQLLAASIAAPRAREVRVDEDRSADSGCVGIRVPAALGGFGQRVANPRDRGLCGHELTEETAEEAPILLTFLLSAVAALRSPRA